MVCSFLADVEEAYHPGNPYHNSIHAADVVQVGARNRQGAGVCTGVGSGGRAQTQHAYLVSLHSSKPWTFPIAAPQALGAMLASDPFARQLSDLEQLAVILAAAVHDLGHPGVNNDFLIRTQSEVGGDRDVMHGLAAAGGVCGPVHVLLLLLLLPWDSEPAHLARGSVKLV